MKMYIWQLVSVNISIVFSKPSNLRYQLWLIGPSSTQIQFSRETKFKNRKYIKIYKYTVTTVFLFYYVWKFLPSRFFLVGTWTVIRMFKTFVSFSIPRSPWKREVSKRSIYIKFLPKKLSLCIKSFCKFYTDRMQLLKWTPISTCYPS